MKWREQVKEDFITRDLSTEDIAKKYKLTDKSVDGKPTRRTIYNWVNMWRYEKSQKNKSGETTGTLEPQTKTGESPPQQQPSHTETTANIFSSLPPPEQPPELNPLSDTGGNGMFSTFRETQEQWQKDHPDVKQVIRFDLIGEVLPDAYEKMLRSRGADLESIDYEKYRTIQKQTTPAIIEKYVPFYYKYALEFNFGMSYIIPAALAGMQVAQKRRMEHNKGDPQKPNTQQQDASKKQSDQKPQQPQTDQHHREGVGYVFNTGASNQTLTFG